MDTSLMVTEEAPIATLRISPATRTYVEHARAANTTRAYRVDWQRFE